jgi:hypothetical protein
MVGGRSSSFRRSRWRVAAAQPARLPRASLQRRLGSVRVRLRDRGPIRPRGGGGKRGRHHQRPSGGAGGASTHRQGASARTGVGEPESRPGLRRRGRRRHLGVCPSAHQRRAMSRFVFGNRRGMGSPDEREVDAHEWPAATLSSDRLPALAARRRGRRMRAVLARRRRRRGGALMSKSSPSAPWPTPRPRPSRGSHGLPLPPFCRSPPMQAGEVEKPV